MTRVLLLFTVWMMAGSSAIQAQESASTPDLRDRLSSCWNSPPVKQKIEPVVVKALLNRDGTLAGKPEVIKRGKGKEAEILAASAVRAIQKCAHAGKLALDPAAYDQWREMIITFDPTDMDF